MTQPILAYVAQQDFVADVEQVAAAIEADAWRPGFLIGVGRGGLTPAVFLSHRLDLPMLSIDYSAQVFGFGDALLINLARRSAGGERLLIVDDINDSGRTIRYLRDALAANGGDLAQVRFAVMIDNLRSGERVDYASRIIDRDEDKSWFVFPWEALARSATLIAEAEAMPERLG